VAAEEKHGGEIVIETCTPEDFNLGGTEGWNEEQRGRLREYLAGFLKPMFKDGRVLCPCCDSHISGNGILDMLTSTFRWGLAHGEGFCSKCQWPFRMYHELAKDEKFSLPLAHRQFKREDAAEVDPEDMAISCGDDGK
jgi:hypothetical protein